MRLNLYILTGLLLLGLTAPTSGWAADGTLSVRLSNDDILLVFINGEEKGQTPLELQLPPGRYQVDVKAAEYSTRGVSGSAVVRSGQRTAIVGDWDSGSFEEDLDATTGRLEGRLVLRSALGDGLDKKELERLAESAELELSCGEDEGQLQVERVDGEPGVRSLSAKRLPVGSCTLKVTALGQTSETSFASKENTSTSSSLELALRWVRINLKRLEPGDSVWVRSAAGKEVSVQADGPSSALPLGDAEVYLRHREKDWLIASLAGKQGTIEVEPYGSLLFPAEVIGPEMTLEVDGESRTLAESVLLPTGEHLVRLSAPGRHPLERTVTLRSGEEQRWAGGLAEVVPGTVRVRVEGPESWSLKGSGVESTDGQTLSLPPGEHRVRVEAPGWDSVEEVVTVAEGGTEEIVVTLEALPVELLFSGLIGGSEITLRGAGEPRTLRAKSSDLSLTLPPGEYEWEARAKSREPTSGKVRLEVGEESVKVAVVQALLASIVKERKTRVVSGTLGGVAGGFAGVGIYFVADAQALYNFAQDQHAEYASATTADDALWFGVQSADAVQIGQEKELIGIGLIAAGSGLAVGALVYALTQKKAGSKKFKGKPQAVGFGVTPQEEGLSFGIAGRW